MKTKNLIRAIEKSGYQVTTEVKPNGAVYFEVKTPKNLITFYNQNGFAICVHIVSHDMWAERDPRSDYNPGYFVKKIKSVVSALV